MIKGQGVARSYNIPPQLKRHIPTKQGKHQIYKYTHKKYTISNRDLKTIPK